MTVELTPFGILVLSALFILLFKPNYVLIPVILFLSPFQASTVLNINIHSYPIGIQPAYFVLVIYIFRCLLMVLTKHKLTVFKSAIPIYIPLVVFTVYAVLSSFIIPFVAKDKLLVNLPRGGGTFTALHFSATNVSQSVYLILVVLASICISTDIIKHKHLNTILYKTYLIAILVVCLLGIYQVGAWYLGLPSFYDFLYTSPAYALIGSRQVLEGAKRLSATFSEPSFAAQYLIGAFAFLCENIFSAYKRTWFLVAMVFVTFVAIILTTSTTAYISVFFIFLFYILRSFGSYPQRRLWLYGLIMMMSLVIILGLVMFFTGTENMAVRVITASLITKWNSSSFAIRSNLISGTISLLFSSFGFGAGWGSHRSSSWLFNLLGNAGIWGTLLFIWFGYYVVRRFVQASKRIEKPWLLQAVFWSVVFILLAGVITVADFSIMALWINISWLIGLISQKRAEV